jgi:type II secretory pathway pseudopilin PulG
MRHRSRPARTGGFSLVEVMISAGILAVVSAMAVLFITTEWRHEALNRDREFAHDRAQSMLEELRAFAEVGENQAAATLDQYDDGTGFSYTLTTLHKVAPNAALLVDPDSPVSGNVKNVAGSWRYARRITVRHFPGVDERDLRIVTVRMFLNDRSGTPPGAEIANCSSVIRTVADATPPTQVYDVYFVALENVPGWWVYMDTIRPFVEASLQDLVGRNPGLKFRTHWITKLGYGRDPEYTPYFNDSAPSTDPIPYAYFYPGLMPTGSSSQRYYVAGNLKGRANVDGLIKNGYDSAKNPLPYSLADQHNHCLRLPEEEALFAARVAAGQEKDDEPTWRLLLERMNTNPDAYRNAVIVNLHGELMPLPPLRNYSDAAKLPATRPGVRAVTHPEKIRFTRDPLAVTSDDVRLRVYTYRTTPGVAPEMLDAPVLVEIPGMDLTANVNGTGGGPVTLGVGRVSGGLDQNPVDGTRDAYVFDAAPVRVGATAYVPTFPGQMYARVWYSAGAYGGRGATVVELHNSPLTASTVASTQGLDPTKRLYGMEYIPCPTEAANDFTTNLASIGGGEKNTARWTIRIPAGVLGAADRSVEAVTRIGSGSGGDATVDGSAFSTGIMYPPASRVEPQNVSHSYCWWASTTDAVPFTERYQFQGDPRHCPYADLRSGGSSFPNGYNWYFDDLENGTNAIASWPGLTATRLKNNATTTDDGWNGRIDVDVPRLFALVREGLQRSEALFTTLTGFSYYYIGLGNEIGYDAANGYANSIPVSGQPFGAAGSGYEQSIINSTGSYGSGVKYVRSGASGSYWWERSWLGDLCPDSAYAASWQVPVAEDASTVAGPRKGNLPAGANATDFRQVTRDSITVNLPTGTTLRPSQHRTQNEGCTSMMNVGTAASTFHHQSQDGTTGAIADGGTEVGRDFHFPLPATARISRPFRLATNADGGIGDEFNFLTDYPKSTATLRRTYFGHSTGATGSGLVELSTPGIPRSAFIVVSGIDRTTESGSSFIARFAMLTLIHGLLSAGDPALPAPIGLPPRIVITSPTAITELQAPTTINVTWHTEWRRWDGLAYTTTFPSTYTRPDTSMQYVLIYSADNGVTWKHMQDDSLATPGVLPAAALCRNDLVAGGDETFTWATPAASFPAGTYRIRIEAYRTAARLHYSFHEERIYVSR